MHAATPRHSTLTALASNVEKFNLKNIKTVQIFKTKRQMQFYEYLCRDCSRLEKL